MTKTPKTPKTPKTSKPIEQRLQGAGADPVLALHACRAVGAKIVRLGGVRYLRFSFDDAAALARVRYGMNGARFGQGWARLVAAGVAIQTEANEDLILAVAQG